MSRLARAWQVLRFGIRQAVTDAWWVLTVRRADETAELRQYRQELIANFDATARYLRENLGR